MNRSHRVVREGGDWKAARVGDSEEKPWTAAALWSAVLLPFALLVYGGCNWINSRRPNVGTMFFAWEKSIPFVPMMIIPYASLFLFLAGAPFVCRNRAELHTLVKRFVFAYLASAVCFLLFPLQFGIVHPPVAGQLRAAFAVLAFLDRPYNLAPSLHIVQWVVAWRVYRRHSDGLLKAGLQFWFALIGLSPVLTYQHHIFDALAGGALGTLCVVLFPEAETASAAVRRQTARSFALNA